MKTVCFLGDSITRRGYWIAEILEHFKTRGIVAYNCGVSGDSASHAISRLYSECLNRTPDTVVMMFGMNDIGLTLYEEGTSDTEDKKRARLEVYARSVRRLCEMLDEAGCDVILCTPTPYNDVTPSDRKKCAANEGLRACAAIVRGLADDLGIPCVDFFAELTPMLGKEYTTLPDLVHPTPESHHPMAQIFLRTLGWIDTYDPTPFLPMSEEAQARYDVEQHLREIHFIEWNQMYGERTKRKMTHADFLSLAEKRLEKARTAGDERQIKWYETYLATVENREEYESELVWRTLRMAGKRS